ncbi:DUF2786 domain-containing protein [Corynebacterium sp. LK2510]|uniref:DUF2786 domain-containing protein n=1 Tax=Corynebacterium sp. LK2510 TaxID=3110472 RepID=UPI0034CE2802
MTEHTMRGEPDVDGALDGVRDMAKLKAKVRKLLNQAADREGTAEGDAFYERAFELMAAYGFRERDIDNPDDGADTIHLRVEFDGAYTDMQSLLLLRLADAMHCTGFAHKAYNSTRTPAATIFGLRCHVERVRMLHALLSPVMIAGARHQRCAGWYDTSTVVKRRSFMTGFISSVGERLARAEDDIAAGRGRYALALIDDRERALALQDDFAQREGLELRNARSNRTYDSAAFGYGVHAGSRTDLGQERVGGAKALPF